jgi:hypothetical protein
MRSLTAGATTAILASLAALWGDPLSLSLRGDQLFVATAKMDLFREPILHRLRAGSAVPFDFHLTLWVGSRSSARRRAFERFVVSYDLWEEKYAVSTLRKPRSSAAGLTPLGVESWCLHRIAIPAVDLRGAATVWARLDVNAAESSPDPELLTGEGLSLTSLIELLSRPSRKEQPHWSFESGAVPVASLPQERPR